MKAPLFDFCYPSAWNLELFCSVTWDPEISASQPGIQKFCDISFWSPWDFKMSILWPLLSLCLDFATFLVGHQGLRYFCSEARNPEILGFFILEPVRPLNVYSLTSLIPLLEICNFSARSSATQKFPFCGLESWNFGNFHLGACETTKCPFFDFCLPSTWNLQLLCFVTWDLEISPLQPGIQKFWDFSFSSLLDQAEG